ncbi:cobalt-precorrin-6A reductase [Streptomyces sp. A3M-1-3]|uniref:cobalt-precorrin-6A reductase n=1 Tax=Streptomyces sp. A3M-1-3 TaxID=2962044 RepID=UPI0020B73F15|nr:cobalt-precorrin-6A reductase [Streptomyces sp. A3M-1-3]MCP3818262.1 cobalt-precorrin-6A reductase [Streptomyces sp. A3M-1-3]
MTAHILILGGTAEARRLAQELAGRPGLRVTSSLAGRVAEPRMPPGEVRVGGFGGVAGLADWLRAHEVAVLVDATHPFAETMSAHAAEASARTGTELLALRRPGWEAGPGDQWHWTGSLAEAAALLPALGTRILLTTGRLGLAAFADPGLGQLHFLVRSVDPPEPPLPRHTRVVLDRGPYTLAGERELLRTYDIDVLVTKDSGGQATAAKLTAARELGLPVVVVRRPDPPAGVTVVTDAADALDRIDRISS